MTVLKKALVISSPVTLVLTISGLIEGSGWLTLLSKSNHSVLTPVTLVLISSGPLLDDFALVAEFESRCCLLERYF